MKKRFLIILMLGIIISITTAKIKIQPTKPGDPNPEDVDTLAAPAISNSDFNQQGLV